MELKDITSRSDLNYYYSGRSLKNKARKIYHLWQSGVRSDFIHEKSLDSVLAVLEESLLNKRELESPTTYSEMPEITVVPSLEDFDSLLCFYLDKTVSIYWVEPHIDAQITENARHIVSGKVKYISLREDFNLIPPCRHIVTIELIVNVQNETETVDRLFEIPVELSRANISFNADRLNIGDTTFMNFQWKRQLKDIGFYNEFVEYYQRHNIITIDDKIEHLWNEMGLAYASDIREDKEVTLARLEMFAIRDWDKQKERGMKWGKDQSTDTHE